MLIDTHAHLNFPDLTKEIDAVLKRAGDQGVSEIICIGTDIETSELAVELAQKHANVWATVGIHPSEAGEAVNGFIGKLRAMAADPRVVAIGEIGLDYHRLPKEALVPSYKSKQAEVFLAQLRLAEELGLNAVIHQRDSWNDCWEILLPFNGKVRGVYHCFGGSIAEAKQVLDGGHLVSFTGIVTFKSARVLHETVAQLPADAFMVETDCPYLAPVPYRGQRCEPAHTRFVAERVAQLRETTLESIAELTTETARGFFNFKRVATLV